MSIASEIQRIKNGVDAMKSKLNSQGFSCSNIDDVSKIVSEKGVGGSVETAQVVFESATPSTIYYIDSSDGSAKELTSVSHTVNVPKGSLFIAHNTSDTPLWTHGARVVDIGSSFFIYQITSTSAKIGLVDPMGGGGD